MVSLPVFTVLTFGFVVIGLALVFGPVIGDYIDEQREEREKQEIRDLFDAFHNRVGGDPPGIMLSMDEMK